MDYENIKINFERLKKVLENDGNCLCKLNTKCPCPEFVNERKCVCGVYKTK
ncbi:MAG: hypothetical protein JW791_05540 [Nanoarchaeota archaeon]|nr:hypothetical protein [Nanoarchaeota archaeon]